MAFSPNGSGTDVTQPISLNMAVFKGATHGFPQLHQKVKQAARLANIDIRYSEPLPAARALKYAAFGKLDGIVPAFSISGDTYESLIKANVALAIANLDAWFLIDADCPASLLDLQQKKALGVKGFIYMEKQVKPFSQGGYTEAPLEILAPLMLKMGRADYIVLNHYYAKLFNEYASIKRCIDEPLFKQTAYLFLHVKHLGILEKLEQALKIHF